MDAVFASICSASLQFSKPIQQADLSSCALILITLGNSFKAVEKVRSYFELPERSMLDLLCLTNIPVFCWSAGMVGSDVGFFGRAAFSIFSGVASTNFFAKNPRRFRPAGPATDYV